MYIKHNPVSPADKTAALLNFGMEWDENTNSINYVIIVSNVTGDMIQNSALCLRIVFKLVLFPHSEY